MGNTYKKIVGLFQYLIKEFKYIFSRDDFLTNLSWDEHWLSGKDRFATRLSVINRVLNAKDGKVSVADIGAGAGDLLKLLLERNKVSKDSVGVDISKDGVERIQKLGLNGILADITGNDFKLSNQFDFVIMSEIIEHIRDVEEILLKLKSTGRYGIIITTPNLGYIWFRLRLLLGRFPQMPQLPPREHIRFWTVIDFKIWARQLGFKVNCVKGCSGFPVLYRLWPSLLANDVLYWIVNDKKNK